MNEKTVIKNSKYVFLVGLVITALVSLIFSDISYLIGLVVGYVVSLLVFLLIIKTSELILHIKTSTIGLVMILYVLKLLLYSSGFLLAIKCSMVNLITVFIGYFIVKITIYIDTYRSRGGEKIDG